VGALLGTRLALKADHQIQNSWGYEAFTFILGITLLRLEAVKKRPGGASRQNGMFQG
jgi:hypothetical protein